MIPKNRTIPMEEDTMNRREAPSAVVRNRCWING
jgi:hypothetical protein